MPNLLDLDHQDVQPDEVQGYLRSLAQQSGLNPDHILKMAQTESNYNPNAVSTKGAMGLMQLMPNTAKQYGVSDPMNWRENAEGGVRYFKDLLDKFGGDYSKATAAYNFGPERVAAGKPWPQETQDYVAKITGQSAAPTGAPSGRAHISDVEALPETVQTVPNVTPDSTPNFWRSFLSSLGGPPTQYAFDPEYRKVINQNIPSLAAGAGAAMVPGAEEFAPGFLSGSPIAQALVSRVLSGAARAAGAGAGYAWGELGRRGIEGQFPKTAEEFGQIGQQAGPQAALQGLFEIPGMVMPAASVAYNRYRGAFKPSVADEAKGVVETGLREKIPLSRDSAKLAQDKIEGLNTDADKLYADNLGSTHDKISLKKAFLDWIQSDEGSLASQRKAALDVWNDAMADKPSEISLSMGRSLKKNLSAKVPYGELGTPTHEAKKALAHIIGESENAIDPEFRPINLRRKDLINYRDAAEKFVNNQYSASPISPAVAYPLAGAVGGATVGAYTHRDPLAAASVGAAAGMLRSPIGWSRATQFIAEHPELVQQIPAFGARKLVESTQPQGISPQNLEDLKVNLMNSPYLQGKNSDQQ